MWGYVLEPSDSEQGPIAGICDHFNEPPVSIKHEECFHQLNTYWILKKDSFQLLYT
jgi:hypothetical protein